MDIDSLQSVFPHISVVYFLYTEKFCCDRSALQKDYGMYSSFQAASTSFQKLYKFSETKTHGNTSVFYIPYFH